jgi:hypothetical protein
MAGGWKSENAPSGAWALRGSYERSSYLRLKEHLSARAVDFQSINIAADPDGLRIFRREIRHRQIIKEDNWSFGVFYVSRKI